MASVTQLIPTLTGGISQQADELKYPGQVNVADNVIPDITQGLMKRPGGQLVKSLSDGTLNTTANGKFFHYYRDENEQYIGQVSRTGDINMWRCSDGQEMPVNYDSATAAQLTSYLTHTNDEDIQTLNVNDYTFFTNRTKTVSMTSTIEPVRPPEVYIELKQVKYATQYSVNLFDDTTKQAVSTVTRITVEMVRSSNNYCGTDGGMTDHVARVTNVTRCDATAGDNRDELAPNVGTRVFNVGSGTVLTDVGAQSTFGATDFSYQANIFNKTDQAGQLGRSNLYFRLTTTGQSTPVGGDPVQYRAKYTTTYDLLYGGEGWQQGDYFYVYMLDGYYKIIVDEVSTAQIQSNLALARPNPTSFDTKTTVTAESILGDLRQAIVDEGNFTDSDITQIGNGLYITRASGVFNASTPVSQQIGILSNEILTVEDLPKQCKHGFVIKIANSESDDDDYYLKFIGQKKADGTFLDGIGVWEECVKPGVQTHFDPATMPIQLVSDGTSFTLSQVSWEEAQVGDTDALDGTNPRPSFVGKTINKMVFFRNRLVMLSDENIILSRPGNFFNFWSKTATTFTDVDVIDISCSSTYPAIVYDAIQVNAGLVLFTKNQQFMLTTDSDILNPSTAKINAIASYNFNYKTNPISLGTTVGFIDNANKFSRFFEMSRLLREGEPEVTEQSKVVSQLFENDLKLISNSRENSIIFFSEENTSTLYGYRYFVSDNERLQQGWFTWTLTGTIRYHCMLDDALYVIVRNNNKDQLLKYSIKLDDQGNFVSNDVDYPIHLDHATKVTTNANSFNAITNKTTVPLPSGFESTNEIAAYDTDNGNNLGRYSAGKIEGANLILDGDWSSETFLIGYLFNMNIELPTLYYTYVSGENYRADLRSNLVIHRLKFSFGKVGVYSVTIDRQGKPSYTEVREVNQSELMTANSLTFLQNSFETIPCYERNTNLKIKIQSKHPSPATILSYNWEGDYTNKSYKRV